MDGRDFAEQARTPFEADSSSLANSFSDEDSRFAVFFAWSASIVCPLLVSPMAEGFRSNAIESAEQGKTGLHGVCTGLYCGDLHTSCDCCVGPYAFGAADSNVDRSRDSHGTFPPLLGWYLICGVIADYSLMHQQMGGLHAAVQEQALSRAVPGFCDVADTSPSCLQCHRYHIIGVWFWICRHLIICSHEGVGCSGTLRLNLVWQSNSQARPRAVADLMLNPLQVSSRLPCLCCLALEPLAETTIPLFSSLFACQEADPSGVCSDAAPAAIFGGAKMVGHGSEGMMCTGLNP